MTTRIKNLNVVVALTVSALLISATAANADILGPYTADGSTTHLWHLDDVGAKGTAITDAVGGLTLNAINGASNGGELGFTAFDGTFGTAGRITRDFNTPFPESRGWANSTTPAGFVGSNNGPFTVEMLINVLNPVGGDYTEIFRDSTAGQLRGRLTNSQLEFTNNGEVFTTAAQTVNTDTWYHLAFVYDGVAAGTNDTRIYWTEMNAGNTSANLVGTFTSTAVTNYSFGNFEMASQNGGTINAMVDEVRISSIARAADDMMFGTAEVIPEPSATVLAILGLVGFATLGWRRRK